jgi:hypothetical protein
LIPLLLNKKMQKAKAVNFLAALAFFVSGYFP